MRRSQAALCLLLTFLVLLSGSAFAKEVWMAPTTASPPGNDGNDGLTINTPVATMTRALNLAVAGDTIQMRAGTYPSYVYMDHKSGAPGAFITIRSYDGDLAANHDAAFMLMAPGYLRFEGINFSVADSHCINMVGISIGYQQFEKANHLEFLRCRFHERDTDGVAGGDEVIKSSQSEYLLFEDCEVYVDNGTYTSTSFALDFVYVCYTTLRRMYFHDHNGAAVYTKGGSQYNVLEQSVLAGCRPTSYGASIQTGDGTGLDFANPNTEWETEYYVVRNNVLRWGTRCAFFVSCVHGMYAYNNLLIDCGDSNQTPYPGIRPYVANWSGTNPGEHMNGRAEQIRVFNNIFYDTAGDMGPPFGHMVGETTDWQRGNNNYYNNGSAIPASTLTVDGVLLDPSTEPGATIGNPDLNNATGTATTRQGWIDLFRPKWTTQSNNMLKEKGSATAGNAPYPSVINDIEGWPRPCDGSWEIGPFEYHGTLPPPNAVFGGAPTTGVVPLAVQFTDSSWGVPTSWSWTFGDGNTSTAQNPSHTYTSVNSFTVALTVQSSQGSDTETKPGYITTIPIDAKFNNSRAFGQAPWTVSFTDASIGVPIAWSWTFGDGATATTQNPSHTYNANGMYTVSLTATSAYGSDTETKAGLVTICDPVVVYPANYDISYPAGGSQHVVSGSLSSLQNADDVALVIAADTINPLPNHQNENRHYCRFTATTAYTPAQVAGVTSEIRMKFDYNGVCEKLILACPTTCPIHDPSPTTYTTYTHANGMLGADGSLGYTSCGFINSPNPLQAYSFYADKFCWYVFVKPTGGAPVANFSGTPTSGPAPLAVSFTDTSTGSPTAWSWTFGDGNSSTAQNPSHTYAVGTCTVSLTATNASGSDGETKNNYITVTVAPPVANFSGTPTSGTAPLAASFTDTSTNSPTAWSWSFGDSSTSTVQNPSHTYAAGTYTVSLTATNAGGSDGETKTNYITVTVAPPVANFTGTPTTGTAPLAVSFTDTSTNSPTAWSWSFGDASTSTVQNPSHTYNSAGDYTVTLMATNAGGSDGETKTNYITVSPAGSAPMADFTANVTLGTAPLAVTFTDTSTNTPTAWSWTFGDGNTSIAQNPSHTYNAVGNYTVTLTATNAFGSDGETKTNYITVGTEVTIYPNDYWMMDWRGATIVAGTLADVRSDNGLYHVSAPNQFNQDARRYKFTISYAPADLASMTLECQFKSSRTDVPLHDVAIRHFNNDTYESVLPQQLWGDVDRDIPPFVRTAVAEYLLADQQVWADICGCPNGNLNAYTTSVDLIRLKLIVKPGVAINAPTASFTGTPTSGNPPLAVVFTDNSTGSPSFWAWEFGDGTSSTVQSPSHSYSSTGTYSVTLTADNGYGSNTLTRANYITVTSVLPPVANFTGTPTTGTAPLVVSFTDTSTNTPTSWSWTFGDSATSTAQNPSHTYAVGTYTVTLTATNAAGSDAETKTNYITAIPPAPVANFAGTPTTGTAPLAVSFTDLSSNSPTAWSWTFGDGNTSTAQSPSHTYAAGAYTVSLTATNAGGSDGETKTNYITVTVPAPVANFSGSPTSGTAPLAVSFTDLSSNSPTSWSWNFGDANTSTVQNPSHTYAAGAYTVTLTATNAGGSDGETKTDYISATSVPAPVADFTGTPTLGLAPLAVSFTDTSTNTPTAWSWSFGDSGTSAAQNPSHTYNAVGNYTVTLTATNAGGSDGETKTNYVAVCTEVTLFPNDYWMMDWRGATIVAGTLADVRSDNGLYHVSAPNQYNQDARRYKFTVSYAPADLAQFTLECQFKSSRTDVPLHDMAIRHFDDNTYESVLPQQLWGDVDRDIPAFVRTAVGEYLLADGQVWADICGCPNGNLNAYTTSVDFIRLKLWVKPGTTISAPTASFTGTPTTGYVPLSVTFTDSSTGTPNFWAWEFGDGTSSTVQSPSHTYSTAGTYSVTLTVNNGYGSNSLTRSNYITANNLPPAPVANFSGTPTTGNAPLAVSFTDSSTNTPTAWSWDFGDSNTSTVQNPSHTYAAGTYTVSLTATNAGGSDGETKTNYITANAAAPTYVARGSVASSTGAITPALPSGIASNDILLLFLETANEAITISSQNGGTWTQVTNSPQGYGTAGASTATRLTVFWSRYNGTQGAPTTSDSGDHQLGRIIAIRGATTSGDPCNVTAGGTESTVDTSGAIPGTTTTVANTLVVVAIATSLPDLSSTARFSGWTNADLTSVTERTDNSVTAGNGGGLGIATGVKAAAGAYSATSVTLVNASTKAMMSIAIKP